MNNNNIVIPGEPVFPYQHQNKYAGMSQKDTALWNTYIKSSSLNFDACQYNVRVGEGVETPLNTEPNIESMAKKITQLRIDVIAYKNDIPTIIELKPIGSCTAIGQILCYKTLLNLSHNLNHPIRLMLICYLCPKDIQTVATINNIKVHTLPLPYNSNI